MEMSPLKPGKSELTFAVAAGISDKKTGRRPLSLSAGCANPRLALDWPMKNILFVEDDANVVEIYGEGLRREGFEVLVARDGLAAIKSLHQAEPDLVVLDLMMPQFNGADVLKFIRATPALMNTKVLIFSNDCMTQAALEAQKLGADASLLKFTCTIEQFMNVVKTLLGDGQAS